MIFEGEFEIEREDAQKEEHEESIGNGCAAQSGASGHTFSWQKKIQNNCR